MSESGLENCSCPYCGSDRSQPWAMEAGFSMVKCGDCEFLFLNRRPNSAAREKATQMGVHGSADDMDISERYSPRKAALYRSIIKECLADVWERAEPITWLDIGAGYGEVVEAVSALAAPGSRIAGLEPMVVKATAAQARGLDVTASFIGPDTGTYQYASLINVFSHINDFDAFLREISMVLVDGGELLVETGDMEKLRSRADFPGDLGLPDHVAFATGKHLRGFLERNGFEVVSMHRAQIDGYFYSLKNLVKKLMGRNVILSWPYRSPYRTLRVRARKRAAA